MADENTGTAENTETETAPLDVQPPADVGASGQPPEGEGSAADQHPADPAVEVAKRDPDAIEGASDEYRKEFVIEAAYVGKGYDHTANIDATRQELINHGLRPVGKVSLKSKTKRDARNVTLTYAGRVVPAGQNDPANAVHVAQSAADDE